MERPLPPTSAQEGNLTQQYERQLTLNKAQTNIAFSCLREFQAGGTEANAPIAILSNNVEFLSTLKPQDRERWESLFADCPDVTSLIRTCYQPLVLRVAQRYGYIWSTTLSPNEQVNGGKNGLEDAIRRFSVGPDSNFFAYATPYIIRGIQLIFQEKYNVSLGLQEYAMSAYKALEGYRQKYGVEPTDAQLRQCVAANSDILGIAISRIDDAINLLRETQPRKELSLNVVNPGSGSSLIDGLSDDHDTSTDAEEHVLLRESVQTALGTLSKLSRWIVTAYFGLDGLDPRGITEIANAAGIHPSEAEELLGEAMVGLRDNLGMRELAHDLGLPLPDKHMPISTTLLPAVTEIPSQPEKVCRAPETDEEFKLLAIKLKAAPSAAARIWILAFAGFDLINIKAVLNETDSNYTSGSVYRELAKVKEKIGSEYPGMFYPVLDNRHELRLKSVRKLHEHGIPKELIAKVMDVSDVTVGSYLGRLGLEKHVSRNKPDLVRAAARTAETDRVRQWILEQPKRTLLKRFVGRNSPQNDVL